MTDLVPPPSGVDINDALLQQRSLKFFVLLKNFATETQKMQDSLRRLKNEEFDVLKTDMPEWMESIGRNVSRSLFIAESALSVGLYSMKGKLPNTLGESTFFQDDGYPLPDDEAIQQLHTGITYHLEDVAAERDAHLAKQATRAVLRAADAAFVAHTRAADETYEAVVGAAKKARDASVCRARATLEQAYKAVEIVTKP